MSDERAQLGTIARPIDGRAAGPRHMLLRRLATGVAGVLSVVLPLAGVLFAYGGMMPPTPEANAAYAAQVAMRGQPVVAARFTIPVPGCLCHSEDPVVQVQHSTRRFSECSRCHGRA